jgi:hypothetical protein
MAGPYGAAMRRIFIVGAALVALATTAEPAAAAELPLLRIDSARAIPDEPKVRAHLRMPGYRGRIGIERRGQSSQMFPKRSYAVELARDAPLLGMPADDDWVLYAGYNDKTLMRNVVAYATARSIGRYAARTRFVELRLNGRYQGVYVLMERLELGPERVAGEALYEFTFPFQARSKDPSFRTPMLRRPIVWGDPERGDLAARRARALARPVKAAERALYGPGSWRRRLDAASAVDFALLNELFKNEDGFHASTYMALGVDGRVRLGPIWDFDISMGNSDYGPSRRLAGWMLARRVGRAPLPRPGVHGRDGAPLAGAARGRAPGAPAGHGRRQPPRAARRGEPQLPPLAGPAPPDLAEPGGAGLVPRRGPVPALLARAADHLARRAAVRSAVRGTSSTRIRSRQPSKRATTRERATSVASRGSSGGRWVKLR